MRPFLLACLIVLSPLLFINKTLADICTDVEQETGLDLNDAECYVLKQVEGGERANLKQNFPNVADRTVSADFLKALRNERIN